MNGATPGPWRYERDQFTDEEGPIWLVEDVAGRNIILAKIPVLGGDDTHSEHETEANANLIAAAPDLLEAAEQALEHLIEMGPQGCLRCEGTIDMLRHAIAKARVQA